MSDQVYFSPSLGNPGGWGPERLRKIPQYKQQIIEGIASGMFISEIGITIGVSTRVIRKWMADDPDFAEAYTDAESAVTDTLEKSAITRARDGILEPVVSGGKLVMDPDNPGKPLMVRRYSDGLLQFLLKGRRRETYGEKREIDAKLGFDVAGAKDTLAQKFAAAMAVAGDAAGDSEGSQS